MREELCVDLLECFFIDHTTRALLPEGDSQWGCLRAAPRAGDWAQPWDLGFLMISRSEGAGRDWGKVREGWEAGQPHLRTEAALRNDGTSSENGLGGGSVWTLGGEGLGFGFWLSPF